jgi:hypothetical protein
MFCGQFDFDSPPHNRYALPVRHADQGRSATLSIRPSSSHVRAPVARDSDWQPPPPPLTHKEVLLCLVTPSRTPTPAC